MDDIRSMARNPRHQKKFEKLLRLAAGRGETDLVIERLSWGIDPNGQSAKGRTAMIANVRGPCPSAATIRVLLEAGADPNLTNLEGFTALDYARRKLMKLQARSRKPQRKSPSLDENNQLLLDANEQTELDEIRKSLRPDQAREFIHLWWQERVRAAKRVFNDPDQVDEIVQMLTSAAAP